MFRKLPKFKNREKFNYNRKISYKSKKNLSLIFKSKKNQSGNQDFDIVEKLIALNFGQ